MTGFYHNIFRDPIRMLKTLLIMIGKNDAYIKIMEFPLKYGNSIVR
jgi:hypothetical protein